METAGIIRLVVESRIQNVSLIGGAVQGIAGMLSLDKISSYHLELCVVEAVNNAIIHAYHSEAGHFVEVDIQLYQDRICFKILDRGQSMNLSKVEPLHFDPRKVETLPERGMGRFICKALMDEISYETIEGLNILTMCKYLKKQKSST